jgi:hypothetical protein
MEKVKAAIDPNLFVHDLSGGVSRRAAIFGFGLLVRHGGEEVMFIIEVFVYRSAQLPTFWWFCCKLLCKVGCLRGGEQNSGTPPLPLFFRNGRLRAGQGLRRCSGVLQQHGRERREKFQARLLQHGFLIVLRQRKAREQTSSRLQIFRAYECKTPRGIICMASERGRGNWT